MRGRDKLLEPVAGEPLIARQARMAGAATEGPVLVTLPPAPHLRYEALGNLPVTQVPVPDADRGISASLRCGINALPPATLAVMVLLADLPDLTADDLRALCAAVDLSGEALIWRGATETGAAGHPIVFARPLFDALCRLEGDRGGADIIRQQKDQTVHIRLPGDRALRDLDTPEDWAAWRAAFRQNREPS